MFGSYPFASVPFAASLTDVSTVPAVQDLIADQDSVRAYLFHATPYDPVGAAETDVYASIGLKYPIVDSIAWPAILKTACDSNVDLFSDDEDAQGRTSFGNLELMIGDGEHDDLPDLFWDGRTVEVLLGAEGFTIDEYQRVLYGTAEDITYSQRRLGIVFRGKEQFLDNSVQENEYGGTGGLDGGEELEGNLKPLAFGFLINITPVLVDEDNLIYQFHDGQVKSVLNAFDGGLALSSQGDVADIEATTVSPGFYKTQLSGGYIKLGSVPEKLLTLDIEGDATGGYQKNASPIIKRILLNYTDLTGDDLDLPSFFAAGLDSSRSSCGIYIRGETVKEAITSLMYSIGGAWTFNRLGKLHLSVFRKRRSAGTITENDIVKGTFERTRTPAPSWRRRLGYRRAWTVMSEDQYLGATPAGRRNLTSEEYRSVYSTTSAVKTSRAGARVAEKDTLLSAAADSGIEVVRQQVLFSGNNDRVNMTTVRQQFKYTVGQTITVEYPRYDFPKEMIILGIRENTSTRQTTFRLWG